MTKKKSTTELRFDEIKKIREDLKNITVKEAIKYNLTFQDLGIPTPQLLGLDNMFLQFGEATKLFSRVLEQTTGLLEKQNPVFIAEDWYLSEFFYRKLGLVEMYKIDPIKLGGLLLNLFEANKDSIKNTLIQNHQNKNQIIKELFTAYETKLFHSVVILSYSMTDGISKEKFGLNFWGYDDKKKITHSSKISELIDSESVLNLVRKRLKVRGKSNFLDKHIEEKEKIYSNNRHCVIHGDSYLYGTKVNAVKSIFLLDFISSLHRIEPANQLE
jgi:hypothetical protein